MGGKVRCWICNGMVALFIGLAGFMLGLLAFSEVPLIFPPGKTWIDWASGFGAILAGFGTVGLLILALVAKDQWLKTIRMAKEVEVLTELKAKADLWETSLLRCAEALSLIGRRAHLLGYYEREELDVNQEDALERLKFSLGRLEKYWDELEHYEALGLGCGAEIPYNEKWRQKMLNCHSNLSRMCSERIRQVEGAGASPSSMRKLARFYDENSYSRIGFYHDRGFNLRKKFKAERY